jgi:polyisoprenoid-binding protein YceI
MSAISVPAFAGTYLVDADHSSASFAVRHMGISTFRGSFADVQGRVEATPQGELVVSGTVASAGISVTRPAELRAHLLGPDFLAEAAHPAIAFAGEPAVAAADGSIVVEGELSLRGVSRRVRADGSVTPPVEDPFGGVRAAIELTAAIDRRDYGMTWNLALPKGGDALGAEVTLSVHLELIAG